MIVIRLADGRLWLNSPAPLDDSLRRELDALGSVAFVTPSSTLHGHLFMEQYSAAYPGVELWMVPRLDRKRPELEFAGVLGEEPEERWAREIDQAVFRGIRRIIELEVEFFHRPTGTLILGDLAFNIGDEWPLLTRAFARVAGARNRLAPTRDFRLAVRDREAARRSLERIMSWDFDRVIPGHGDIVERGGRAAFERGVRF